MFGIRADSIRIGVLDCYGGAVGGERVKAERLTQRIILPDGEVRYFLKRCHADCINERKCLNCPRLEEAIRKLGEYENVSDPAYELIKELEGKKQWKE